MPSPKDELFSNVTKKPTFALCEPEQFGVQGALCVSWKLETSHRRIARPGTRLAHLSPPLLRRSRQVTCKVFAVQSGHALIHPESLEIEPPERLRKTPEGQTPFRSPCGKQHNVISVWRPRPSPLPLPSLSDSLHHLIHNKMTSRKQTLTFVPRQRPRFTRRRSGRPYWTSESSLGHKSKEATVPLTRLVATLRKLSRTTPRTCCCSNLHNTGLASHS